MLVRLKWNKTEYKGQLVSTDNYLNFQLDNTYEILYENNKAPGAMKKQEELIGNIFIRCNNVLFVREWKEEEAEADTEIQAETKVKDNEMDVDMTENGDKKEETNDSSTSTSTSSTSNSRDTSKLTKDDNTALTSKENGRKEDEEESTITTKSTIEVLKQQGDSTVSVESENVQVQEVEMKDL